MHRTFISKGQAAVLNNKEKEKGDREFNCSFPAKLFSPRSKGC